MSHFLDAFFKPRGIAIIGASNDPGKLGYAVTRNLLESGYTGQVHLVNPKKGTLFGHRLYGSVAGVPDPVDLAVVIVPAASAAQALRETGQRGIHAAILTSGGFREVGPQGVKLEADVRQVCHEFGIRLIGPNCVGLLDTHFPFDTTFLPPPMPARGDLAFLSHSGAFCAAVIDWSRGQGFGFSRLVSLGNQADLTETDLLPIIADDPATKTICLYLETIADGQKFIEKAERITRQKPIVALKVGRTASGQKAAASHTGALAGSEAALTAAFEKAGVLRAASAEQLFDWARALSACPLPAGRKTAILTSAGGPGVIAADALEAEGLTLTSLSAQTETLLGEQLPPAASTHNPVDMLASASPQQYATCLQILLKADEVDSVVVILLPPPNHLAEKMAESMIPLIHASPKPVLMVLMGSTLISAAHERFVQAGIPAYPFPERAASALGVLSNRVDFLSSGVSGKDQRNVLPSNAVYTSAEQLVSAYGIATSPLVVAASQEEAARAAGAMEFPLVAKIASADIPHKSDIGGVLLNLQDVDDVIGAYSTLLERARSARPDAHIEGITLQHQVAAGQELIIGAVRDPQFGALMMFGAGGVEAEELKDISFALAPLDHTSANAMLKKTWAGKKLDGFRSIEPADREAVIEALIKFSWLAIDHPEIAEIEINPLRALQAGVYALDVRMKSA